MIWCWWEYINKAKSNKYKTQAEHSRDWLTFAFIHIEFRSVINIIVFCRMSVKSWWSGDDCTFSCSFYSFSQKKGRLAISSRNTWTKKTIFAVVVDITNDASHPDAFFSLHIHTLVHIRSNISHIALCARDKDKCHCCADIVCQYHM